VHASGAAHQVGKIAALPKRHSITCRFLAFNCGGDQSFGPFESFGSFESFESFESFKPFGAFENDSNDPNGPNIPNG
jgi:hypothetical protein